MFGSCLALLAVLVALFIPDVNGAGSIKNMNSPGKQRQRSRTSQSDYESATDSNFLDQENIRLLTDDSKPN